MSEADPFTGVWEFQRELSETSGPAPRHWVQTIECEGDEIRVREEMDFGGEHRATLTIEARFNGKPYPVVGSAVVDAMAYTRTDERTIQGTASWRGAKLLEETVVVSKNGQRMSMAFTVFRGGKKVARGQSEFQKVIKS